MPVLMVVQCEKCKAQKKDVNHWWVLDIVHRRDPTWTIRSLHKDDIVLSSKLKFYCGVNCLLQDLQSSMTAPSLDPIV